MHKAFIFDLDAVLLNDEAIWEAEKQKLYSELLGEKIYKKLGSTLGINMDEIYSKAVAAGAKVSRERFLKTFYEVAEEIYSTAPLSDGVNELAETLVSLNYRIAIVSASPLSWITTVTKRLLFEDKIELIISLHERDDLMHKPAPDGYLEAMKVLEASPNTTIVLEDSNSGIKSAKASGAYTIGLKQNLVNGYVQEGADYYAKTMNEVAQVARRKSEAWR